MTITYPPEMLPRAEEEGADVIVVDGDAKCAFCGLVMRGRVVAAVSGFYCLGHEPSARPDEKDRVIAKLKDLLQHADAVVIWENTVARSGFQEEIEAALRVTTEAE